MLLIIVFCYMPHLAMAQDISTQPICFNVINDSEHRVYGEIATDYITRDDGQKIHHTGSFRLEAAGTRHEEKGHFLDRAEFCSSGPFFPQRQLELVIRTLIPVFSCKFTPELGDVIIQSATVDQDGIPVTKRWANCL